MSNPIRISHLPYSLERIEGNRFRVVTRMYSPLAARRQDHVVYEARSSAMMVEITPEQEKELSWDGEGVSATGTIELFKPSDRQEDHDAYLKRLDLLKLLEVGQGD